MLSYPVMKALVYLIPMEYTTFLIDLDETVYPASCGVWEAISERMERYMHERLNMPLEEIPTIRTALYQQYGTTLRGLQVTRHVDEHDFIDYVHDIPLAQFLKPDPALREVLKRYPQRKIVFTNADRKHAGRVIEQMQLEGCFDAIVDIYDIAPYCKPMPEAYQKALALSGENDPQKCVFIDDSPRNLVGARATGMYTIQVGTADKGYAQNNSGAHAHIARLIDLPTVIAPE